MHKSIILSYDTPELTMEPTETRPGRNWPSTAAPQAGGNLSTTTLKNKSMKFFRIGISPLGLQSSWYRAGDS